MAKYLIGNIKGPKGDTGAAGADGAIQYTAGTGITIENNVISATNSGGITTETDPVFSASPAAGITAQDITDWDAKSDFSGSYNDLTNKPDLTVYATTTALGTGLARKQDTLTAGTNITIDANNVISATGGSNYGDEDVADYLADNFGLEYSSVDIPVASHNFTAPKGSQNTIIQGAPSLKDLLRTIEVGEVNIYDSNNTVLGTLQAQTWYGNQGGAGPTGWGSSYVPASGEYGITFTISAMAENNYVPVITYTRVEAFDFDHMTGSITLGGKTETIGKLQDKFLPDSALTTIQLNSNPNMIRQPVLSIIQNQFGMGTRSEQQTREIYCEEKSIDNSGTYTTNMEISNPADLTKSSYVAIFFDGALVGNARNFSSSDGVYSSFYTYNDVNYSVSYDSMNSGLWTVIYPTDLYNTVSNMFIVYCYNERVQVQRPLNAEYIPVDNNTITVNNGVLVASSSGGEGSGTTYTAGNGIEIFNDVISVDTDVIPVKADLANYATQTQLTNGLATKQNTLTGGTGVYINDNQITVDVMALLNAGTGITLSDYDNSISIDNSVVALKSDIPAANTYGDADVADYISDTFGMGVSETTQNVLWGQTSDPQYIGEDSQAEVILTGSGSSDPFQNGGNTQYPVEFEIRQNSNDELVSSVNDTFLSQFIGSEYSPVYHFSSEDGNKSFDLGYYSDA